jgi:APA family basic amino acid/polyamine antiporter
MTQPTLKRTVTLPLLTLYGLGNILGAGIYVLIGEVVGAAGFSSPLAFLVAMVIAGLTAFSYMELSSRYPVSASVSVYLHEAFGHSRLATLVGLLIVLGGISSAAALSLGFAGYFLAFIGLPKVLISAVLLLMLGGIAIRGIGESAKFASLFTLVEVFGLLLIIIAGREHLLSFDPTQLLAIDPAVGWGGVFAGAFLAFYAFIGFEDMVNISEEVKNPRRTMAYAILASLGLAAVLYLATVVVSIGAVPASELGASDAPLALVLQRVSSLDPILITFIGLAATINGALVQLIMGSRILYGLADRGWISPRFAELHETYRTPVLATIVVLAATILGAFTLPLVSLAKLTSLFVLAVFVIVNISLIVIKQRHPATRTTFEIPVILPVLGALTATGILLLQLGWLG